MPSVGKRATTFTSLNPAAASGIAKLRSIAAAPPDAQAASAPGAVRLLAQVGDGLRAVGLVELLVGVGQRRQHSALAIFLRRRRDRRRAPRPRSPAASPQRLACIPRHVGRLKLGQVELVAHVAGKDEGALRLTNAEPAPVRLLVTDT